MKDKRKEIEATPRKTARAGKFQADLAPAEILDEDAIIAQWTASIDRIARRAFDGEQWMDREGRAATTGNTYCGNLLWQSGLTLLAPQRIPLS